MLLWTLGKRLEDHFDGANRKNLLHFIQENDGIESQASQTTLEGAIPIQTIRRLRSLTYTSRISQRPDGYLHGNEPMLMEKRDLLRISACAIFHKYNPRSLGGKICAAELGTGPNANDAWLAEIRTLVENATHIVPHYHVVSRSVHKDFFSPVMNFLWRLLSEDAYRRIATMFPETADRLIPADE
ncbi:hypothetical protein AX15_003439 [Amanita polypyramis BW_CC]|nr:hypothetical protein AX15_003439 [Amanita polypyramis BW_CC]